MFQINNTKFLTDTYIEVQTYIEKDHADSDSLLRTEKCSLKPAKHVLKVFWYTWTLFKCWPPEMFLERNCPMGSAAQTLESAWEVSSWGHRLLQTRAWWMCSSNGTSGIFWGLPVTPVACILLLLAVSTQADLVAASCWEIVGKQDCVVENFSYIILILRSAEVLFQIMWPNNHQLLHCFCIYLFFFFFFSIEML